MNESARLYALENLVGKWHEELVPLYREGLARVMAQVCRLEDELRAVQSSLSALQLQVRATGQPAALAPPAYAEPMVIVGPRGELVEVPNGRW